MSNFVVMLKAQGWLDNPEQSDSFPCDSVATGELWKKRYLDAGWNKVWLSHMKVVEAGDEYVYLHISV
jgi:hypothetical protein